MELELQVISHPDKYFWKEFDDLSEANFVHNVQYKSAWLIPYIKNLLRGELYIIAVYKKQELVGCLPLEKRSKRATRFWNFSEFLFLGSGPVDFFDILTVKNKRRQIIQFILEHLKKSNQWDHLILSLLPDDLGLIEIVKKVFGDKYENSIIQATGYRYENTEGEWESYQREIFNPKNKDLAKSERRLNKDKVTYNVKTYKEGIYEQFKIVQDLYAQRRESLNQWNKYGNQDYWCFLQDVLDNYEQFGGVEFSTLVSGTNEVLALQLDFINKNIRYHWNHAYNEDYKRYSPGKVLLREVLKNSFEDENISSCNHMRGLSGYKEKLTSSQEMFYEIKITHKFSKKIIANKLIGKILPILK